MVSNTSTAAAFNSEKIDGIDKFDESTESFETADMFLTSQVSFDEYKSMVDGFRGRADHESEKQQHAEDPCENDSSRISFSRQHQRKYGSSIRRETGPFKGSFR